MTTKTTVEKEYRVSPVNLHNYRAHYFYGFGDTPEEALADGLRVAKLRDPNAYIHEGAVYFRQPVYF